MMESINDPNRPKNEPCNTNCIVLKPMNWFLNIKVAAAATAPMKAPPAALATVPTNETPPLVPGLHSLNVVTKTVLPPTADPTSDPQVSPQQQQTTPKTNLSNLPSKPEYPTSKAVPKLTHTEFVKT